MPTTPTIIDVRVVPDDEEGYSLVTPVWADVEVPDNFSWVTPNKLVARLVKAVNAGVVFTDPKISTMVDGRTYVECGCKVFGRHMNADLKRLGY